MIISGRTNVLTVQYDRMNEMGNLIAVRRVLLNNVTACFVRKHKATRRLNFIYLINLTARTSDCSTRSESNNNTRCTANKSVPLLQ